MKMFKSLILFVVIYTVVVGCTGNESTPLVCETNTIVYHDGTSETHFYTNNRLTSVYGYDAGGNNTYMNVLAYDAKGRLSTYTYNANSLDPTVFVYSYDANNRLAQYEQVGIEKIVYTYNSHGQAIKTSDYFYNISTSSYDPQEGYVVYNYSSPTTNNFSSIVTYTSPDVVWSTISYTWDNKHNPNPTELIVYFGDVIPDNNALQITTQLTGNTYISNYSYTYNSNGYPLTRTRTVTGIPDELTTFTYSNCK